MLNQHLFTVDMQVIGRSYRDVLTPHPPPPLRWHCQYLCYLFLVHPLATSSRNLPLAVCYLCAPPFATSRFHFLSFFFKNLVSCPRDCCITDRCPLLPARRKKKTHRHTSSRSLSPSFSPSSILTQARYVTLLKYDKSPLTYIIFNCYFFCVNGNVFLRRSFVQMEVLWKFVAFVFFFFCMGSVGTWTQTLLNKPFCTRSMSRLLYLTFSNNLFIKAA